MVLSILNINNVINLIYGKQTVGDSSLTGHQIKKLTRTKLFIGEISINKCYNRSFQNKIEALRKKISCYKLNQSNSVVALTEQFF